MELGKSGKREHLIYYDNVAERDREILEGELGRKLVPYELPFTIGTDASRGFASFTPLSLSNYEIFKLLGGYHNVLRLDSDVCIQQDISKGRNPNESLHQPMRPHR